MAWSIAQKFSPRQSGAIRSEPLGATAGTKSRVRTLMAAVPRVERAVQQARFTISDQPGSHGGIRTRVTGALPDQGGPRLSRNTGPVKCDKGFHPARNVKLQFSRLGGNRWLG